MAVIHTKNESVKVKHNRFDALNCRFLFEKDTAYYTPIAMHGSVTCYIASKSLFIEDIMWTVKSKLG